MPVKTTLLGESVCEAEPKFGKTGGGRWLSYGCQSWGLYAVQLLRPSGDLRFKSLGVSRGADALSGDIWVQTVWKYVEAPQGLQLVPHPVRRAQVSNSKGDRQVRVGRALRVFRPLTCPTGPGGTSW